MSFRKRNIWDQWATSYHALSNFSLPHQEKYIAVAEYIIQNPITSIFDLGCGTGALELALEKMGYRGLVVGVDNSVEMLRIAKKNNPDESRYHYFLKNIEDLRHYSFKKFDCITAINSLFLLQNVRAILKDFKLLLNKSGLLIIVSPKPSGSLYTFVRSSLRNKSTFKKISVICKALVNIHHIVRSINFQHQLDNLYRRKTINYLTIEEQCSNLIEGGFKVIRTSEIQADQNWLIIATPSD